MDRVQHNGGGDWRFNPLSTVNVFLSSSRFVNDNVNAIVIGKSHQGILLHSQTFTCQHVVF